MTSSSIKIKGPLNRILRSSPLRCLITAAAVILALAGVSSTVVLADDGKAGLTYASQSCNWPDNNALDAVVPIAGEDGSYASGVVINQNRVLTAAHALSPAHRVYVHIGGQYRQARIMLLDRREDLAMLSVDTTGIVPLLLLLPTRAPMSRSGPLVTRGPKPKRPHRASSPKTRLVHCMPVLPLILVNPAAVCCCVTMVLTSWVACCVVTAPMYVVMSL